MIERAGFKIEKAKHSQSGILCSLSVYEDD